VPGMRALAANQARPVAAPPAPEYLSDAPHAGQLDVPRIHRAPDLAPRAARAPVSLPRASTTVLLGTLALGAVGLATLPGSLAILGIAVGAGAYNYLKMGEPL